MPTRTIFNDGSKQLAHNLDDLYDRWMFRRSQIPEHELTPASEVETFLPDVKEPTTTKDGEVIREILRQKKNLIDMRLMELQAKSKSEGWTKKKYYKERGPLGHAITRANLQLTVLNSWAKAQQIGEGLTYKALVEDLILAQRRIIELQDEIIKLRKGEFE